MGRGLCPLQYQSHACIGEKNWDTSPRLPKTFRPPCSPWLLSLPHVQTNSDMPLICSYRSADVGRPGKGPRSGALATRGGWDPASIRAAVSHQRHQLFLKDPACNDGLCMQWLHFDVYCKMAAQNHPCCPHPRPNQLWAGLLCAVFDCSPLLLITILFKLQCSGRKSCLR